MENIREHLIQHIRVITDSNIISEIQLFNNNECIIERASILKKIKEESDYTYEELSVELFENKRQLIRINKLNNLIKELKYLTKQRLISKTTAYEISSFTEEKQKEYYQFIQKVINQKKNSKRKAFKYADYIALKDMENTIFFNISSKN